MARQTGPDSLEAVVTDVPYPVFLGFASDESLYVTEPAFGVGAAEGDGWLARVDLAQAPLSLAGVADMPPTCPTG